MGVGARGRPGVGSRGGMGVGARGRPGVGSRGGMGVGARGPPASVAVAVWVSAREAAGRAAAAGAEARRRCDRAAAALPPALLSVARREHATRRHLQGRGLLVGAEAASRRAA
eukprot:gene52349-45600_t